MSIVFYKSSDLSHRHFKSRIRHCQIELFKYRFGFVWLMVFNATFNNISTISCRSVLFEGETRVPGDNHRSVASYWQTWWHNVVSSTPRHERGANSQLLCKPHPSAQKSTYIYIYIVAKWFTCNLLSTFI